MVMIFEIKKKKAEAFANVVVYPPTNFEKD